MNLPPDLVAEIDAAVSGGGSITVLARQNDLAPLVVRHGELCRRSDLDEDECEELASLSDLLDVAERYGWHTAPRQETPPLTSARALPAPPARRAPGRPVTSFPTGACLRKDVAR